MGRFKGGCGIGQNAAQNRGHAQRIEISAGNQLGIDLLQLGAAGDSAVCTKQDAADSGDFGKRLVLLPELAEKRIREELPASVGQTVHAAGLGSLAEQHELLRIAHW